MKKTIGIFDSGIGGLSLLSAIHEHLPSEDWIYIADQAFAPYGHKSEEAIKTRTEKICQTLINKHSKLILIACNTVTTQVIDQLRSQFTVPFVGVEPAIKPAARLSQNKTIGILATEGTLKSNLYNKRKQHVVQDCTIIEKAGIGLVEFIESGDLDSVELKRLLKHYLKSMIEDNIDTLVLGCTHYPFLYPVIREILPKHIQIIDNSIPVAKQIKRLLTTNKLSSINKGKGKGIIFSTAAHNQIHRFTNHPIQHLSL